MFPTVYLYTFKILLSAEAHSGSDDSFPVVTNWRFFFPFSETQAVPPVSKSWMFAPSQTVCWKAALSICLHPGKGKLLKGLIVPNGCGESCNLHLNRKIPKRPGVHFSFYNRRQSIFYVCLLMFKGHRGAGLCCILLAHSQLDTALSARVKLNICPEQHPKKKVQLEGRMGWGCYWAANVENTHTHPGH